MVKTKRCVAAECGNKTKVTKTKLGWLCNKHKEFYVADLAAMK